MCVLAFAWRADPQWPLVIAANRDEHHARPTGSLARWREAPGILAGRDLQSGGTWLGVSEQGRIAAVTNVRATFARIVDPPSRGHLVAQLLAGEGPHADISEIDAAGFDPFKLIHADRDQAWVLTNRPEVSLWALGPGVYGLSNGPVDEAWPKTERLVAHLRDWLDRPSGVSVLLDILRSEERSGSASDSQASEALPDPSRSPLFIRNAIYGTRSSTVVAIDAQGQGTISERTYDAKGESTAQTDLAFAWPWSEPAEGIV